MLIRITDLKGQELWLNPVYVKAVASRKNVTEIYITAFGPWSTSTIKTMTPVEEVANLVNSAMPEMFPYAAAAEADDELRRQQAAAAAAAG